MQTSYYKLKVRDELSILLIRKMDSEWFACEVHKLSCMMIIRKHIINEFLIKWCRNHNNLTTEADLIKRQERMKRKAEEAEKKRKAEESEKKKEAQEPEKKVSNGKNLKKVSKPSDFHSKKKK